MTVYTASHVFSEAFSVFRSMLDSKESIDCILRGEVEEGEEEEGLECHKLVLSAVSPYFRAMFRNQDSKDIRLHGVQTETLRFLINYFYTASDLLLLDWVSLQCQQFLMDNLHLDNVVTAARLANIYRMSQLDRTVLKFCESQFCELVKTEDWLTLTEDEVCSLLSSDGLVTSEDTVLQAVLSWWTAAGLGLDVLDRLLTLVRFSLCPPEFLDKVRRDDSYQVVAQSEAFKQFDAGSYSPHLLHRSLRARGNTSLLCVHHDDSDHLYTYSPDLAAWSLLADLPPGAGVEYAAIAGLRSRLYLVGGRSRDGRSLRSVFCYDLSSSSWSRLSDMKEVRWYHGALVLGSRLYAVAGCTQLDSVEYLELGEEQEVAGDWQKGPAMSCPRHLPGVASLHSSIYVCGGSDDNWGAHHTVERLDTETNSWSRLADMQVPRIQPTVVAYQGNIYVMGGRNSNKVELMSAERYDPGTDTWHMIKEMRKKRWGGGGAVVHSKLVVVGGKGRRVGQTGEVYSEETNTWTSLPGDCPAPDRSYNACVLSKPWNWSPPM